MLGRDSARAPARTVKADPAGLPDVPAGCARTVYGALITAGLLPRPGDSRRRGLRIGRHGAGIEGIGVDRAPGARPATAGQRALLTWRDRHCAFPGCDRPVAFALHAHHLTPCAHGGRSEVDDLRLYCARHHTTVHHG